MTDIKSMLLSELQEDFALRGLQNFRAAQVYRWLHQRGATSFDEMTDLSKDLRVALKAASSAVNSSKGALRAATSAGSCPKTSSFSQRCTASRSKTRR